MSLLHLDRVSVQLGQKQVLQDLKLVVDEKARIGVIGPNGSGKSSLLKVMAGEIEPDSGRIIAADGLRLTYVPQTESFLKEETIEEAAIRLISKSLEQIGAGVGREVYPEVLAAKALTKANFEDITAPVSTLSGGWRKRLALSAAFAIRPEVVLLDEPTNHLDREGLIWLEDYLCKAQFAWVLVSHDRYFLDQTVSELIEISPLYSGGVFSSTGGYFAFKEKKEEYMQQEAKRTSSLANRARRELEWASRSPKARTGKASYRVEQAGRLKKELQEAKSRAPQKQLQTNFQASNRGTKELVECIKASVSFDENVVIRDLSFVLRNGGCIGLLGANGQGKSTLLKLFGGALEPTKGKVKRVFGLRTVYFDQLRESLAEWNTLGELLGNGSDHVVYEGRSSHLIGWAKRFGFEADDFGKSISKLSGGEQARALLSILVRQEADLLLLDEPTNDLDIQMLEALEKMILEFPGAVVLITHDRFMLDEVCTEYLGFLDGGELIATSDRHQWIKEVKNLESNIGTASQKKTRQKKAPTKLSFNEAQEFRQMESKITNAEKALEKANEAAADPEIHSDPVAAKKVYSKMAEAKLKVEELYARWEELEALKQSFES